MALQKPNDWYTHIVEGFNPDIWPDDDPEVAFALGRKWTEYAKALRAGGKEIEGSLAPILSAWGDDLGHQYYNNARTISPNYETLAASVDKLATLCQQYGESIIKARNEIKSELIQGAIEAAASLLIPGLGWAKALERAGRSAWKIFRIMKAAADALKAMTGLPKLALTSIKAVGKEMVDEVSTDLIRNGLNIKDGVQQNVHWNEVRDAGLAGAAGVPIGAATRGITNGAGSAARRMAGRQDHFIPQNVVTKSLSAGAHNAVISPTSSQFVQNAQNGNVFGGGYVDAFKDGAWNSAVIGSGRAGMSNGAEMLGDYLHGGDSTTPPPNPPTVAPPDVGNAGDGVGAGAGATGDAGAGQGGTGQAGAGAGGQSGAGAGATGDAGSSAGGGSSGDTGGAGAPTGGAGAGAGGHGGSSNIGPGNAAHGPSQSDGPEYNAPGADGADGAGHAGGTGEHGGSGTNDSSHGDTGQSGQSGRSGDSGAGHADTGQGGAAQTGPSGDTGAGHSANTGADTGGDASAGTGANVGADAGSNGASGPAVAGGGGVAPMGGAGAGPAAAGGAAQGPMHSSSHGGQSGPPGGPPQSAQSGSGSSGPAAATGRGASAGPNQANGAPPSNAANKPGRSSGPSSTGPEANPESGPNDADSNSANKPGTPAGPDSTGPQSNQESGPNDAGPDDSADNADVGPESAAEQDSPANQAGKSSSDKDSGPGNGQPESGPALAQGAPDAAEAAKPAAESKQGPADQKPAEPARSANGPSAGGAQSAPAARSESADEAGQADAADNANNPPPSDPPDSQTAAPDPGDDSGNRQPDVNPPPPRAEVQSLGRFAESRLERDPTTGKITKIDGMPVRQKFREIAEARAKAFQEAQRAAHQELNTRRAELARLTREIKRAKNSAEREQKKRELAELEATPLTKQDLHKDSTGGLIGLQLDTNTGEVFEAAALDKKSELPAWATHSEIAQRVSALWARHLDAVSSVHRLLADSIAQGVLPPGSTVTARDLAAELGLPRKLAEDALAQLADAGRLVPQGDNAFTVPAAAAPDSGTPDRPLTSAERQQLMDEALAAFDDAVANHEDNPGFDDPGDVRAEFPWGDRVLRHAEIRAASAALHANEDTKLADLIADSWQIEAGKIRPIPFCSNCSGVMHDVHSLAGPDAHNARIDDEQSDPDTDQDDSGSDPAAAPKPDPDTPDLTSGGAAPAPETASENGNNEASGQHPGPAAIDAGGPSVPEQNAADQSRNPDAPTVPTRTESHGNSTRPNNGNPPAPPNNGDATAPTEPVNRHPDDGGPTTPVNRNPDDGPTTPIRPADNGPNGTTPTPPNPHNNGDPNAPTQPVNRNPDDGPTTPTRPANNGNPPVPPNNGGPNGPTTPNQRTGSPTTPRNPAPPNGNGPTRPIRRPSTPPGSGAPTTPVRTPSQSSGSSPTVPNPTQPNNANSPTQPIPGQPGQPSGTVPNGPTQHNSQHPPAPGGGRIVNGARGAVPSVPHSTFFARVGNNALMRNVVRALAHAAMHQTAKHADANGVKPYAVARDAGLDVTKVTSLGNGTFRLVQRDGTVITATIDVGPTSNGNLAEFIVDTTTNTATITVSPNVAKTNIERTLGNAFAQINQLIRGNTTGTDLLTDARHPGDNFDLSHRDHGRQGEVRNLNRTKRETSRIRLARRRQLAREMAALVERLGLHPDQNGGLDRAALLDTDVAQIIADDVGTQPSNVDKSTARRPSWVAKVPTGLPTWAAYGHELVVQALPGLFAAGTIVTNSIIFAGPAGPLAGIMSGIGVGVVTVGSAISGTLIKKWTAARDKKIGDTFIEHVGEQTKYEANQRDKKLLDTLLERSWSANPDPNNVPQEHKPGEAPRRTPSLPALAMRRALPQWIGVAMAATLLPFGLPLVALAAQAGVALINTVGGTLAERYLRQGNLSRDAAMDDGVSRNLADLAHDNEVAKVRLLHKFLDRLDALAGHTPTGQQPNPGDALPTTDGKNIFRRFVADHAGGNIFNNAVGGLGDFARGLEDFLNAKDGALNVVELRWVVGLLGFSFLDNRFRNNELQAVFEQLFFDKAAEHLDEQARVNAMFDTFMARLDQHIAAAERQAGANQRVQRSGPSRAVDLRRGTQPAPDQRETGPKNVPGRRVGTDTELAQSLPAKRPLSMQRVRAFWANSAMKNTLMAGAAAGAAQLFYDNPAFTFAETWGGALVVTSAAIGGIVATWSAVRFRQAQETAGAQEAAFNEAKSRVRADAKAKRKGRYLEEYLAREDDARTDPAQRNKPMPSYPTPVPRNDPGYPQFVRDWVAAERARMELEPRPYSTYDARRQGLDRIEKLANRVERAAEHGARTGRDRPHTRAHDKLEDLRHEYDQLVREGTAMSADDELGTPVDPGPPLSAPGQHPNGPNGPHNGGPNGGATNGPARSIPRPARRSSSNDPTRPIRRHNPGTGPTTPGDDTERPTRPVNDPGSRPSPDQTRSAPGNRTSPDAAPSDGTGTPDQNGPGQSRTERDALIEEARQQGHKINPDDVVHIGKDRDGKIVWLEEGNERAGLGHMLGDKRVGEFERAGIPKADIGEVAFRAATEGRPIGITGKDLVVYEVEHNGETKRIAVTVGANGFIVGANPVGNRNLKPLPDDEGPTPGNRQPPSEPGSRPAPDQTRTEPDQPNDQAEQGPAENPVPFTESGVRPRLDERLRRIWDEGVDTDGGRAYFDQDETDKREAANNLRPEEGMYTFDAHGSPGAVFFGDETLSVEDVARLIESDPRFTGQAVWLFACRTGQLHDGFAQQLANRLGVAVVAPSHLAGVTPNGETYVTEYLQDEDGNVVDVVIPAVGYWQSFQPTDPTDPSTWLAGPSEHVARIEAREADQTFNKAPPTDVFRGEESTSDESAENPVPFTESGVRPELNERLRRLYDEAGVDTDGGRAYFDPNEHDDILSAQAVPVEEGMYTFDAHGSPTELFIGEETLTVEDVAQLVEADPRFTGQPIWLFSCQTGLDPNGFAQQLADRLGVEVIAPDVDVSVMLDGRTYLGERAQDEDGNATDDSLPTPGAWHSFQLNTAQQTSEHLASIEAREATQDNIDLDQLDDSDAFEHISDYLDDDPADPGSFKRGTPRSPDEGRAPLDERLRRIWDRGYDIPGGRAYFGPDDLELHNPERATPLDFDQYVVSTLGTATSMTVGTESLSVEDLALLIENDFRYSGQDVFLVADATGDHRGGFAQQLADRLGVEVIAPDALGQYRFFSPADAVRPNAAPESTVDYTALAEVVRPQLDQRLQEIFDAGVETPGGRAYHDQDDIVRQASAFAVPTEIGVYTFDAVGTPNAVLLDGAALSVEDVAQLISADERYVGQAVWLFAGHTGQDANGFAQQLADRLGVQVIAPAALTAVTSSGETFVTHGLQDDQGNVTDAFLLPPTGHWTAFRPNGGTDGTATPQLRRIVAREWTQDIHNLSEDEVADFHHDGDAVFRDGVDPTTTDESTPDSPEGGQQQSGARVRPRDHLAAERWAAAAYERFRQDPSDVADIAANLADVPRADGRTGFSAEEIAQLKKHVMEDEHLLTDYETGGHVSARFDADENMAEAWIRLREGRHLAADLVLLEHELAESTYLREHPGASYAEAHRHANENHNWQDIVPPRTDADLDVSWGDTHGDPGVLREDRGDNGDSGVRVRGDTGRAGPAADDRQGGQGRQTGGRLVEPSVPWRAAEDPGTPGQRGDLADEGDARVVAAETWRDEITANLTRDELAQLDTALEKSSQPPNPGKVPGSGQLTQAERELVARAHEHIEITPATPMQKVLGPGVERLYAANQAPTAYERFDANQVGGYVARVADNAHLTTPKDVLRANRLDYDTRFNDQPLYVMEFAAGDVSYKIPFGAPYGDASGLEATDRAVLEASAAMLDAARTAGLDPAGYERRDQAWPNTGTGWTADGARGVPERIRPYVDVPPGSRIFRLDLDGTRTPFLAYHGRDLGGWQAAETSTVDISGDIAGELRAADPTRDWSDLNPQLLPFAEASQPIPGGRAFYEADDVAMFDGAEQIPELSGVYRIDIHGQADIVTIGDTVLHPRHLAKLIENDTRWAGEPIWLFGCNTGADQNGFAQQLADLLGVEVIAPDGWVGGTYAGDTFVTKSVQTTEEGIVVPAGPPDGTWRSFRPGGPDASAATGHQSLNVLRVNQREAASGTGTHTVPPQLRGPGSGTAHPAPAGRSHRPVGLLYDDEDEEWPPLGPLPPLNLPPEVDPGRVEHPHDGGRPHHPGDRPQHPTPPAGDEPCDEPDGNDGGGPASEPPSDEPGQDGPGDQAPNEPGDEPCDEPDENVPPLGEEPIYVGDERLWPDELADLIASSDEWQGGPIRLLVAHGELTEDFLHRLANLLGVAILVPAESVADGFPRCSEGTLMVYNESRPTTPPDGEWRVFEPTNGRVISTMETS